MEDHLFWMSNLKIAYILADIYLDLQTLGHPSFKVVFHDK